MVRHVDAHVDDESERLLNGEVFELTREAQRVDLVPTGLTCERGTDACRYSGLLWEPGGALWVELVGASAPEVREQYDRRRRGEPPVQPPRVSAADAVARIQATRAER